jgi:hypothetical protein
MPAPAAVTAASRTRKLQPPVAMMKKLKAQPLAASEHLESAVAVVSSRAGRAPKAKADGVAEDSESTETELGAPRSSRSRALRHNGRRRLKRAMEKLELHQDIPSVMSVLELESVGPQAMADYKQCALEFLRYTGSSDLRHLSGAELDAQLVAWMNELYLAGHQVWKGEKLLAGIFCLAPEYGRHGTQNLPRSLRCLKGWRRLCPYHSRKPWAWSVWCAMATEMIRDGNLLGAIAVLVAV